jgi:predicted transcriptional regulator
MGQNNIYQHLKKNKNKWFSVRDLEKPIQANRTCIRKSLNQLLKSGDVERSERKIPVNNIIYYLWKFKK